MELAPVITNDFDGWKVSLMKNGRVQVYLCATESLALKFAAFLAQPPVEKKTRRISEPVSANRRGWADRLRLVAGL